MIGIVTGVTLMFAGVIGMFSTIPNAVSSKWWEISGLIFLAGTAILGFGYFKLNPRSSPTRIRIISGSLFKDKPLAKFLFLVGLVISAACVWLAIGLSRTFVLGALLGLFLCIFALLNAKAKHARPLPLHKDFWSGFER